MNRKRNDQVPVREVYVPCPGVTFGTAKADSKPNEHTGRQYRDFVILSPSIPRLDQVPVAQVINRKGEGKA